MANKKHSLVSKKKGSLHKSGGVNKGAVIGFTIGSVLLVGGAAGGVVGIYFYLKTTPVQLLSVSGDASQGGTTSNIFLTFDQNMGDSSIWEPKDVFIIGGTQHRIGIQHIMHHSANTYVALLDTQSMWSDGEQCQVYVTTPSLQSKYVMQHSSNVYFEITLFKAPTTVNFNSAIPYENSTYTTNTILLNFNEDMGNALETTNVKVISTTDDNSVEVEVTHVERSWNFGQYIASISGIWANNSQVNVTVEDVDGYSISNNIQTCTLYRHDIVAYTSGSANGIEHIQDSSTIIVTFDKNMGDISPDKVTVKLNGPGREYLVVSQIIHTDNTYNIWLNGSNWQEGDTVSVEIQAPVGYTIDVPSFQVELHKADTTIEFWDAWASGESKSESSSTITLRFDAGMGVGALNEKVTAKVVRTNLPLDIDPQVATGTQSNEYIATINDGTWIDGDQAIVSVEPPDGYNIRGNQRTITLYQEQISVSLTPPTANGSANTATSSSIEFQFSRDIGELNNSNIRTTGMTPSGSVPPIVKVSHNTGGTYTATLANIGTWNEADKVQIHITVPDAYVLTTSPDIEVQLHKQKTDVAFLGARADGEKNTATSTAIIFDFNNDMGTLDTSNLTITGFVDDNTRTAPSINSVAHDGGGKYTAHLSADVWKEGDAVNVQMTPPAGYNLNWLTTTVTLHKIDTVVDFTSAGVINDPDGNSIRINLSFYVYSTPYAKSIGELTGRVRILTMRGTTVNIDNVTFNDDEEVYFVTISNDAQWNDDDYAIVSVTPPDGYTFTSAGNQKIIQLHKA